MINHFQGKWENNLPRWCMNVSISTNASFEYAGAWTFILEVYDYGTRNYVTINPIEIDGKNLLSYVEFGTDDKKRSYATATKILQIGLETNKMFNVKSVSSNSTTEIEPNQNLNISLVLNNNNNLDPYVFINQSYSPISKRIQYLSGETGTTDTNYFPFNDARQYEKITPNPVGIDYETGEKTKDIFILKNDENSFILNYPYSKYSESNYIGWIVPVKLEHKFWLNKQNITRIWADINQTVTGISTLLSSSIEVYDNSRELWIIPNTGQPGVWYSSQGNLSTMVHIAKLPTEYGYIQQVYHSEAWDNTTVIKNCIDSDNIAYFRFLIKLPGGTGLPVNLSIDYFKIHVEYQNYLSAQVGILDSISNQIEIKPMIQTGVNSTHRTWSLVYPTSLLSARNFYFTFIAQNGNSSIRYEYGQLEGVATADNDQNYLWKPVYNSSISFNYSSSLKKMQVEINFTNINYATVVNLHRNREPLIFNGTLESKYDYSSFYTFVVQLRHLEMNNANEWDMSIRAAPLTTISTDFFTYNFSSSTWNVSATFAQNTREKIWRSGVWLYRVLVITNESLIKVTDWAEYRLFNYQPKDMVITGLASGQYYRVKDPVPYEISFVDLEGNNNPNQADGKEYKISISFIILNRDKNLTQEKWNSSTNANFIKVTQSLNRFYFEGKVFFGREIQIGSYSDVYIQVSDLDQDWPQVGTIKIFNKNFTVLNNHPEPIVKLDSNMTGELEDKVYRENGIRIYTEIFDLDDFAYQVRPMYLNMTYLNGTNTAVRDCNSSFINNSRIWYFDLFVYRTNTTGYWSFISNFKDPDGDTLKGGQMALNIEILNNLPQLLHMWYKNIDKGTVAYVGNQTNFGIYRGNETFEITADIYDVEDTWLESTDYAIQTVNFTLYNDFSDPQANIFNNEHYKDSSFVLQLVRNGKSGVLSPVVSSYKIYRPISTTTGIVEWNNRKLLNVTNENFGQANPQQVGYNDSSYHNINYEFDTIIQQSTPYYVNFTLEQLFDLHTSNNKINLTFIYQLQNDDLDVFVRNQLTNTWEQIGGPGVLKQNSEWIQQNITLNSTKIRQYIVESQGNVLMIRISPTNLVTQRIDFKLNEITLNYFKTSDEHYERWVGTLKIPARSDIHAGDLKLNMIMMDKDKGVNEDKGNLIRVLNVPPRFTGNKSQIYLNNQLLNWSDTYVIEYTKGTGNWPVLKIYVEAIDPDLPGIDINRIYINARTNYSDFLETWKFGLTGFSASGFKVPNANNLYLIEIIKNDWDNNISKGLANINEILIREIIIADNEVGKCNGTKYPYTAILRVNILIIFKDITISGWQPPWEIIITVGVGIAGAGAFVFYRRYLSYRKYLRTTD
jgi:hypothetical protein